ncbi:MAG: S1 RNA-binding domain-containing protein [Clostridiales bacterium]|nr:S1 RNA-binding domain-containing protein [Clostridiales bacterium]MDD7393202.1 S1 RNA-binding domain-containing protein [Eubacteriales bacterium]
MASAIGDVSVGKVTKIMPFGAFVRLENGDSGLVHISEVSAGFVKDINEVLSVGQEVRVKVIGIDDKNRINLSIKKVDAPNADHAEKNERSRPKNTVPAPAPAFSKKPSEPQSFDDMISKFMKESCDKLSDFKDTKRTRPRRK